MSEATRSVLHGVMEQQTLSISMTGIISQLNAHTSLLADTKRMTVRTWARCGTTSSRFDISILTMSLSAAGRELPREVAAALRDVSTSPPNHEPLGGRR